MPFGKNNFFSGDGAEPESLDEFDGENNQDNSDETDSEGMPKYGTPEYGSLNHAKKILDRESRNNSDLTVMRSNRDWDIVKNHQDELGLKGIQMAPRGSSDMGKKSRSALQESDGFTSNSKDNREVHPVKGTKSNDKVSALNSKTDYIDLGNGQSVNKYEFLSEGSPKLGGYSKHDVQIAQSGGAKLGSAAQRIFGNSGFVSSEGDYVNNPEWTNEDVSLANEVANKGAYNVGSDLVANGLNREGNKIISDDARKIREYQRLAKEQKKREWGINHYYENAKYQDKKGNPVEGITQGEAERLYDLKHSDEIPSTYNDHRILAKFDHVQEEKRNLKKNDPQKNLDADIRKIANEKPFDIQYLSLDPDFVGIGELKTPEEQKNFYVKRVRELAQQNANDKANIESMFFNQNNQTIGNTAGSVSGQNFSTPSGKKYKILGVR